MLEFIMFLSGQDKEILELTKKAGYSIEENTPLCLLGDKFFGFLKREQRTIVICTNNAKKIGGYSIPRGFQDDDFQKTKIYIRRALRHEAVHVAQNCNQGKAMNDYTGRMYKLHPYKESALKRSTSLSGNRDKEYEAYWMEDKPKLVRSSLLKYCL